jgi:hypothetical protein
MVEEKDWEFLMKRSKRNISIDEYNKFNNSIRLFRTNKLVNHYNKKKIEELLQPVYYLKANNRIEAERHEIPGLPNILHLSIGCRVMHRMVFQELDR